MRKTLIAFFELFYFFSSAQKVEFTWESMTENYQVPEWFQNEKSVFFLLITN